MTFKLTYDCQENTAQTFPTGSAGTEQYAKVCALLDPLMDMAAQPAAVNMLDAMTVLRMITVVTGMMRVPVTKEQLMALNEELNKTPVQQ